MLVPEVVPGMRGRARKLLERAISRGCNGVGLMDVPGIRVRAG